MKRIAFLLFALVCTGTILGQENKQKVAVYITDNSTLNAGEFAGDFLVNAIVKRSTYLAVERTSDFLKELNKEQQYQRTGSVDDNQISKLGKQFGVQLVCVVKLGKMGEGYFMSARLIDVETATLLASARPQKFGNLDDIEKTCEAVTASMFDEKGISTSTSSNAKGNTQRHPVEPEMVLVQGGTFRMGCSSEQQGSCRSDENPLHSVTVSTFYIGKYEVTQAQWKLIMGSNPSNFKGDNLPVENVSWDDAQKFISRLNAATGKNYRLPTEAEWEYAARGGNQSRGYKYSGSNLLVDVAWFWDNSGSTTHPVGTKQPNELGIYDMSGNVYEWCYDWYGTYPASAQQDPMGASSGSFRVRRGCGWDSNASGCRVACRGSFYSAGYLSNSNGIRLACSTN